MKIQGINFDQNSTFSSTYKLSEETLKTISNSTKLSVGEMQNLSFDEAAALMKARGAIKEPNKLWAWMCEKYKSFGKKAGLLKKTTRNIYT